MSNTYQAKHFTAEQLDNFMHKVQDKSLAGRGLSMDDEGAINCVAPNYWKLIHTYTHTDNYEVYPEAVDLATGEFTAKEHGLATGQMVFVAVHEPYHMLAPYDFLPGGLVIGSATGLRALTRYRVSVVDEDTFTLISTSTNAVVTYTEVATMDLTKFHFEVWVSKDFVIGDLPELTEAKLVIKGRIATSYKYITPNGRIDYAGKQGFANFDNYSGSASANGDSSLGYRAGWGAMYTTIELKYIGPKHLLQTKYEDTHCFSPENKASAYHNRTYSHRSMENDTFHEISFWDGGCFFNGSTVEVFVK